MSKLPADAAAAQPPPRFRETVQARQLPPLPPLAGLFSTHMLASCTRELGSGSTVPRARQRPVAVARSPRHGEPFRYVGDGTIARQKGSGRPPARYRSARRRSDGGRSAIPTQAIAWWPHAPGRWAAASARFPRRNIGRMLTRHSRQGALSLHPNLILLIEVDEAPRLLVGKRIDDRRHLSCVFVNLRNAG